MKHVGSELLHRECDVCKKECRALPCSHQLKSSEWYCEGCYKSYRMDIEVAEYLLAAEGASMSKREGM